MTSDPGDCFVAVFADESCIGNGREGDNPGGAGALIEMRHPSNGTLVRRDLWISEARHDQQPHGAPVGDRIDGRARRKGRALPGHLHDRLALHRGRHDAVGALVGAPRMDAKGRRDRKSRVVARGDPRRRRRTRSRGNGCVATTATRKTSTRTTSRRAPQRSRRIPRGRGVRLRDVARGGARKGRETRRPEPFPEAAAFRASSPLPSPDR